MTTLLKTIKLKGKGIHSGLPVNIVLRPSKKPGIFFRRIDIDKNKMIATAYDNVGETKMRNTTIGDTHGAHVQTIEHLMAALFIAGVDSVIIDIDGVETPIMDGSADLFLREIMAAGTTGGKMRKIIVKKPVIAYTREVRRQLPLVFRIKLWVMDKIAHRKSNGYVKLSPNDGKSLDITATLVYPEKIIGAQTYEYVFDGSKRAQNTFIKQIARARTFGKYSEWEYLKAHGMGRGADETNVIALNNDGDGTLNKLMWPDEFVRHKIIDAIGDMATSGGMICGKLESYKGSHALNNIVLKKLFSDASNYDIIEQ
ncbi:MAG: UDP-3-O-acyl-N-acetylglucosamine deacetylase [Alphaproteobacteria bacterium]|nr:UDP-3-O-acyl-N-acetylglucosamine deacetylase [Alphaproteobacteria bacterium]